MKKRLFRHIDAIRDRLAELETDLIEFDEVVQPVERRTRVARSPSPSYEPNALHLSKTRGADLEKLRSEFEATYGDKLGEFFISADKNWGKVTFRDEETCALCMSHTPSWNRDYGITIERHIMRKRIKR